MQPKDSVLVSESFFNSGLAVFVQKFSNGECTVDLVSSDGTTIVLSVEDFEIVASAVSQAAEYLQSRYEER